MTALAPLVAAALAAATSPAAAKPSAEDAVRCAAALERMPLLAELSVETAEAVAKSQPTLGVDVEGLRKSLEEAKPAMAQVIANASAKAATAVGDPQRYEAELTRARKRYAALDKRDISDAAFKSAMEAMQGDISGVCQAVLGAEKK